MKAGREGSTYVMQLTLNLVLLRLEPVLLVKIDVDGSLEGLVLLRQPKAIRNDKIMPRLLHVFLVIRRLLWFSGTRIQLVF